MSSFSTIITKVRLLLTRGTLKRLDNTKKLPSLQVQGLANDTHDKVEWFGHYGIAAMPPPDAELLLGAVGADRTHLVAFSIVDRKTRDKSLKSTGEMLFYNPVTGARVWMDAAGTVHVIDSTGAVDIVVANGGIEIRGGNGAGTILVDPAGVVITGTPSGGVITADAAGVRIQGLPGVGVITLDAAGITLVNGPSSVTLTPAGIVFNAPTYTFV